MPTSQDRGVEGADGELTPRPGAPLIAVQAPEFDGRTFGLCLRLRLGENLQPRAPHAHQIKLRLGDPAGKLVTRRVEALARHRDLDLPRQLLARALAVSLMRRCPPTPAQARPPRRARSP